MPGNVNKYLFILLYDSVAYAIATAVFDTNTIIPYFLREIGNPGLVPWVEAVKQASFFLPQLLVVRHVARTDRHVNIITKIMYGDRPQLLLLPLCLLLGWTGLQLGSLLFFCLSLFFLGEGAILLYWMDLLGRLATPKQRGGFFGLAQVLGGIGALVAAFLVKNITGTGTSVQSQYVNIFLLGSLPLLPSLILFRFIKQPPRSEGNGAGPVRLSLAAVVRNPQMIRMITVQLLVGFGGLAYPFYLLDMLAKYPSLENKVGLFLSAGITGTLVGGILWGGLSAWQGNKKTIQAVVLANLAIPLIFFVFGYSGAFPLHPSVLGLGFILLGSTAGGWLGFVNYAMDIATEHNRSGYLFLYNITMALSSIYPLVGGYLRGHLEPFSILFIITGTVLLALVLSLKLGEPKFFH